MDERQIRETAGLARCQENRALSFKKLQTTLASTVKMDPVDLDAFEPIFRSDVSQRLTNLPAPLSAIGVDRVVRNRYEADKSSDVKH